MSLENIPPADWEERTGKELFDGLEQKRKSFPLLGPGKAIAVVVVDMQKYFMRDGVPASDAALASVARLLEKARASNIPVFLIRNVFDRWEEITPFWQMRSGKPFIMREDPTSELHPGLGQQPSDIVVEKKHASSFAGTNLHDHLAVRGIDTILLAGTATSGCVRATAVDGAALHYRMQVVEECTFEHRPLSGPFALYEMAQRYADIISLDDALATISDFAA